MGDPTAVPDGVVEGGVGGRALPLGDVCASDKLFKIWYKNSRQVRKQASKQASDGDQFPRMHKEV
jgi:hypothetical protein